jgi:tRNA(Arg) A34 adenosine deaminase TadA
MNTPNPQQYMQLALDQARLAKKNGDLPFGAVIMCDNKVVGVGKCENVTTFDVTAHAEMNALRQACKKLKRNILKGCIIYCTNEPCPMCAAALFQAKIPHVVIGLVREDLPHLLRTRKILMKDLAEDSGYTISIEIGLLKKEILELFDVI